MTPRLSVRTRLTVLFGALFLVAGIGLLVINYVLVDAALPEASSFAQTRIVERGPEVAVPGRTVSELGGSPDVVTAVAGYRDSALRTMLTVSGGTLLIAAGLAGALGWAAAGRVLRPLHQITATARHLEAEHLDRRIELPGPRDELKDLADTFDGMLDRLAASFDGQRRFVANASHELRTPLALQRTLVEVAMADPEATPALTQLGERLLQTADRTERLLDGLLTLAKSDRGLVDREPVRLDRIAAAALESAADKADAAGLELVSQLTPSPIVGDPILLDRMLGNLIDNAVAYNERGGTVCVVVDGDANVLVTNSGPEVPAAAVPELFEPFRRLGDDRLAHGRGAGLGLSIIRSIAVAHGGSADAVPNEGGGLRVCVRLPVGALEM